ncbi:MAG: hypothetical protein ACKER6_00320 [Candidatus Hodgkinia cicadicola]
MTTALIPKPSAYAYKTMHSNTLDQSKTLKSLILLSTFVINATGVWIFWYYKSHRKNKSYVNRYNLLNGHWEDTKQTYSVCCALIKTMLTRLACASLTSKLFKYCHLPVALALFFVQTLELWVKASIGNTKLIHQLCLYFVKITMWASSLVAIIVALTLKHEVITMQKWFWRGTVLLWEGFWYMNRPKI